MFSGKDANEMPSTCPPWFFFNGTDCECGNDVNGVVYCNPDMNLTFLLNCYCMTYDNITSEIVLGSCIYNCFDSSENAVLSRSTYDPLPQNVDGLNDAMCKHFNRHGQLCSRCNQGVFIPAYSYSLHCIHCTYSRYDWIKYIVFALGPLTLFFVIVVTFRVSVTLPPLLVFVQVCHTLSAPQLIRTILASLENMSLKLTIARILTSLYGIWNLDFFRTLLPPICLQLTTLQTLALDYVTAFYPLLLVVFTYIFTRILTSLYGIWNLDFFRTLLPPICLQLTTLQTLALDYVTAFYPLLLVVFTYIFIELHDHNFRPVVFLWRPFHRCFVCIRRQWNIKTSIIDAFATFLVLSYMKLVSVSTDLLLPTRLFNVHGHPSHTLYLYNDASMEYFGREHLPYAILALTVLLFVVILPLVLLVVYPCQCFQKCLTRYQLRARALHTFMDAFQGCYKDGTNGTRDCRWFAAVYLGARLIAYIGYAVTLNAFFWVIATAIYTTVVIVLIAVRPYSSSVYNIFDPIVMSFLVVFIAILSLAYAALPTQFLNATYGIAFVLYCVPLVYMSGTFLYWMVVTRRIPQQVAQWCQPNDRVHTELEASLADRVLHPEQYERLLPDPVGDEEESSGEEETEYTAY